MVKNTAKHQDSKREQEHAAMLKEALSRPGIHEVMQVYQTYKQVDKELHSYRFATKRRGKVIATTQTHYKPHKEERVYANME